jgi:uncharacterized DUF497 family protein
MKRLARQEDWRMQVDNAGAPSLDHLVIKISPQSVALQGQPYAGRPLPSVFYVDTIKPTEISFDSAKNAANIRERGLPFSLVKDEFDWANAQVIEDKRREYGEQRFRAFGFIGPRLHAVVFTRRAAVMHVISLRKAKRREVKRYATQTESGTD